jgi:hypothetical protein
MDDIELADAVVASAAAAMSAAAAASGAAPAHGAAGSVGAAGGAGSVKPSFPALTATEATVSSYAKGICTVLLIMPLQSQRRCAPRPARLASSVPEPSPISGN